MLDQNKPPAFTVIDASGSRVCRCGSPCGIGAITIQIGELTIGLTVTASGVHWPYGVKIPPSLADKLEPEIELAWLKHLGERWENARLIARSVVR